MEDEREELRELAERVASTSVARRLAIQVSERDIKRIIERLRRKIEERDGK